MQYQQMFDGADAAIGWFDFTDLTMEASATPLLDFQSDPKVDACDGIEHGQSSTRHLLFKSL